VSLTLSPYAGEAEVADPAMSGEFAAELAKMARDATAPPWTTYVARRDGVPVGTGGFKGPLDAEGSVEIGYLTFTPMQRSGVATALAAALVRIAQDHGATIVLAHTLPERNASTRVLLRNGFIRAGDVVDPEDGPVWRWELALA
jgi:RimJ/RimL family protein N-acetyltransferase